MPKYADGRISERITQIEGYILMLNAIFKCPLFCVECGHFIVYLGACFYIETHYKIYSTFPKISIFAKV